MTRSTSRPPAPTRSPCSLFTTTGFSGLPRIESDGGRALTISGFGATIQRSTAGGTPDFRIFDIAAGANVTFSNLTIKNGKAAPVGGGGPQYDEGGGISNRQGSVTVQNCTLDSNSARLGGGIYNDGGSVTSSNCIFNNNSAAAAGFVVGLGGAIYSQLGTVSSDNCVFSNNSATGSTGGIFHAQSGSTTTLTVTNSTFNNNSNTAINASNAVVRGCSFIGNNGFDGGAIRTINGTNFELDGCTFSTNSAGADGGAVYSEGSQLTATACTFSGNSAGELGGAILNFRASMTVNSCTFSGNSAPNGDGGAINNNSAQLMMTNCTLSLNSANSGGGIINLAASFEGSTVTVASSTFSGNSASTGGGIYNFAQNNGVANLTVGNTILKTGASGANIVSGGAGAVTITSQGYNLSNDPAGGDGTTGPGGFLNATGDRRNTDPQIGPLQNNGGATLTHAPLPGSPVIDAGKSFGSTADQRGFTRPFDVASIANASGGDGSDIGAVELELGSFIVTTTADHDDGTCNAADCTLREAINAANPGSGESFITFLPGLTGTIQLASALPSLSSNLTIAGPGPNLLSVRRNSGGNYRIFTASNGTASGPTVSISGLTITNGLAPSATFPANSGGGILNDRGTLTVSGCHITGNSSDPGSSSDGGGIFNNDGTLFVNNSTLSGNNAYTGGGICHRRTTGGTAAATITNSTFAGNTAPNGFGGAIFNQGVGTLGNPGAAVVTLTNCTLSGNSAANSFGGAIYNAGVQPGSGSVTLTNCTLSGNSATNGGIFNFKVGNGAGADVILRNNIFKTGAAGANLVNSGGAITSQGHNLSNDNGGGFLTGTADQINTDPQLGSLADNGGPTQTHALLSGSPAINGGDDALAPSQDQRGFFRLGVSDIGAFESGGIELRITGIARSGGDIVITFAAVTARTYRLERKLSLIDGNWQSIPGLSDLTPGANDPFQFTDPGAISLGRAFYRVRLLPP